MTKMKIRKKLRNYIFKKKTNIKESRNKIEKNQKNKMKEDGQ